MGDEMRKRVRDIIADIAIGTPFADLMEHYPEWCRLKGMKNGRYRDPQEPHQCDVTEATDAILSLIASELERVERERDDLIKAVGEHVTVRGEYFARATAAEARLAEAVARLSRMCGDA